MTITADFSGGRVATTEPLYQWDTGQKLALSGLPQTASDIQVHFANAAMAQAIVKATELVGSLPTCDIPNEFLQFGSAAKARAWVFYRASDTEGYTVRTVLIPVTPRKRPNDYVSPEDPDSHGIVERAIELLEGYEDDLASAYTFDATTTNVVYNGDNPKTIYLNAYVNGKNVFVLTTANNYYQIALCYDGTEYVRELTAGGATTYKPWVLVNNENTVNKTSAITASNKTSTTLYPSIKAVVDYLAANYENLSNKLSSEAGIDEDSTDTEYPTAKAVFNFGADILDEVVDDLVRKENLSNKKNTIAGNETSEQYYPSIKAVHDAIENLEAIPYSVKLAMDTLFSKAAYADDDAASSYATFHAWAISNLVTFITAVFTQGSATIHDTDSLDTLKQYLTVTATYSDSTTATVTDYTLSGTLTKGTSTITVSYGGKTATFEVTVKSSATPAYALYIPATNTGGLATGLGRDVTNKITKIVLDCALPVYSVLSVIFQTGAKWVGVSNGAWDGTLKISATPAYSEVAGQGRSTITFEIDADGGSYLELRAWRDNHPEMTIYGFDVYSGDTLQGSFRPTSTVGEMMNSVSGSTINWTDTAGMTVTEVE